MYTHGLYVSCRQLELLPCDCVLHLAATDTEMTIVGNRPRLGDQARDFLGCLHTLGQYCYSETYTEVW